MEKLLTKDRAEIILLLQSGDRLHFAVRECTLKYSYAELRHLIDSIPIITFGSSLEDKLKNVASCAELAVVPTAQLNATIGDEVHALMALMDAVREKRNLAFRCRTMQSDRQKAKKTEIDTAMR